MEPAWIVNTITAVLFAIVGYVVKNQNQESERSRNKIAELYTMISNLRVEAAEAKSESGKEFVSQKDFAEFKTDVFRRFDKTDDKLDRMLTVINSKQNSNGNK